MGSRSLLAAIALTAALQAMAHPPAGEVVPEAERERAQALAAEGPTETRGVEAIHDLGSLGLGGQLKQDPEALQLRARELHIAPGGVVGVHAHSGRPGVAYILEGEILEHRSDTEEPILRRAGDTSFEYDGLWHWWHNDSESPVRALVVDIVPRD